MEGVKSCWGWAGGGSTPRWVPHPQSSVLPNEASVSPLLVADGSVYEGRREINPKPAGEAVGKTQNPSELRVQHGKPNSRLSTIPLFSPPKISTDGKRRDPNLRPHLRAFGHIPKHCHPFPGVDFRADPIGRCSFMTLPLSSRIPNILQLCVGGVNSCNEWLIASGRPGGRRYFQLRWIPGCQTGGKEWHWGGDWGKAHSPNTNPAAPLPGPSTSLITKGRRNPPPPNHPPGLGRGEDEHGFPYGLIEGHFLSIAQSINPTSGAPWIDMERLKDPSKCGVGKGRGSHLPEGFADNYLNLNNNYFFSIVFYGFFCYSSFLSFFSQTVK